MTCRQCEGIERLFDESVANRDLKSYRKKGPSKTTQVLIDAIKSRGVEGKTLLDIGGGVGVIQHELLKAGARSSTSVDASTAYIQAAKEEAQRQGHSERIAQHHENFVDIAQSVQPANIVTLDRVICCYHDVVKLVGQSSERATELYGIVIPRDNWGSRIAFRVMNLFFWIRRSPFRAYVHPGTVVESLVRSNGLQQLFCHKTFVWQVVVYAR